MNIKEEKDYKQLNIDSGFFHERFMRDYINYDSFCRIIHEDPFHIKRVIFNNPATIILWDDGTKTVVKAQDGEEFDKEKGVALCFMKRYLGNKGNYNNIFKKYIYQVVIPND